jgi:hypothetical protein
MLCPTSVGRSVPLADIASDFFRLHGKSCSLIAGLPSGRAEVPGFVAAARRWHRQAQ